jgi:hypothetical protein
MAIAVTELPGRSGAASAKGERTYQRTFKVVTDDRKVGAKAVLAAVPVAFRDAYTNGLAAAAPGYETDTGAFCQAKNAQCTSPDGRTWTVTVDYAPFDPNSQQDENPLDEPPQMDWDAADFEEVVEQDVDGNPVINSAGDPFDPPLTRDNSYPILVITRNEATFSPGLAYSYRNKVNAATFFGSGPRTVRCRPIVGKKQYHAAFGTYYQVTYRFEFNPDGFDKNVLNQGLRRKAGTDRKAITTKEGQPISSPVPLDADGVPLDPTADPIYLTFKVNEEADFAAFGFPGA